MGAVLEDWWAGWWDILDVRGCVSDDVDVDVVVGLMEMDGRRGGTDGGCAFVVFFTPEK